LSAELTTITNSADTLERIRSASIESLATDEDLALQSDYILSIVPPRDALATARRIADARKAIITKGNESKQKWKPYFFDLNAIAPRLTREIEGLFTTESSTNEDSLCHFIDGGIIGGPPREKPSNELQEGSSSSSSTTEWTKPSIVISGSVDFSSTFENLSTTLNMKLVSPKIGAASTLKLCFASLTKGLTALSILSFTTAQQGDVLPELLEHLKAYTPNTGALATRGVLSMPPKAYRWVDEMRGIGDGFDAEGQWGGLGGSVYNAFAEIYRTVAEDTILGEEKVGKRKRGTTVEDVAEIMAKREKRES
jgi:hypothetical protein